MKRIEILTDIKHESGYFKGEIRVVTPELAGYFVGLGWAKYPDEAAIPGNTDPVTLEVQNGKHGHGAATEGVR